MLFMQCLLEVVSNFRCLTKTTQLLEVCTPPSEIMEAMGNTCCHLLPYDCSNTFPLFQTPLLSTNGHSSCISLKRWELGKHWLFGDLQAKDVFLSKKIPADGFHEGKTWNKMP